MRLKSYFATSVEAAMHQARTELGDEALLLDTRQTGPQAKHLGAYEVVFALPETAVPDKTAPAYNRTSPSNEPPKLSADFADLRRDIDRMRSSVERSSSLAAAAAGLLHDPEVGRLYSELVGADLLPEIVQDLIVSCSGPQARDATGRLTPALLRTSVHEQLAKRLQVRAQVGSPTRRQAPHPIVCVVGPPGAGKTSSLVKLAITQGLPSRKPMVFVSLDNYRVGGSDSLLHYANLIGASFVHADAPRQLTQILDEHRHKCWIWIDTPGVGPRETDVIAELSEIIRNIQEIDTHLVLSAAMKSSDLRVAVSRFAPFEPKKLLFAHLDETETYGGILSAMVGSGIPASFLSNGQQIPEAIEAAQVRKLLSLLVAGNATGAGSQSQAGWAAAGQ